MVLQNGWNRKVPNGPSARQDDSGRCKTQLIQTQLIALRFSSDNALSLIRFLFILLVGYAGFLRADETLKIMVCDAKIHVDHTLVSVPERKNDLYRQGHLSCMYHRKDFGAITS